MITYEQSKQNQKAFKGLCGLTLTEFDDLYKLLEPVGKRILQVLRQASEGEMEWSDPPRRGQGRTLEQAFRDDPDLFAIADATKQLIQQSQDDDRQRRHYSGKQKRHTRKTAIIVNA
ncbi:MAG: hypothetical protein J5I90_19120 [Caldilineales bacterium]|nr:hypothetical protein [Caldilineales bacterium]